MEDYEVAVPFYVLRAFGVRVDCVSPGKLSGQKCFTGVHDFMGFELYTELQGHFFTLNANYEEVNPDSYDTIIIPGGRFTELLSTDDKLVDAVRRFAATGKPVVTSCHSQLMLVAAGLLQGKKCTAFTSLKPVIELAGGIWWEQPGIQSVLDISACLKDGNLISSIGWPAHGEYMKVVLESIGGKISGPPAKTTSVLVDYAEDYEANVPFRALQGLGCHVDAVSPTKKIGESCPTAIHEDEGAQVCSEKRGHNFVATANWDDVDVDKYDCLVLPGGRGPELLVTNEKVISLVKDFAAKGKVIGAIGQGTWILAAANALKGKRCAADYGMKVIVKVAGGELAAEAEGCVTHGNLVTASGWPALSDFVAQLSNALGLSVVF
ncbi:DJ-1 protein homolog E [Linum perenne]